MKETKLFPCFGVILILSIGLIHVIDAPDSFSDAAYKGWLFYANGLCSLIAAYGIYKGRRSLGWNFGFFIAAVSIIGYIVSRTIGLPLIPPEPSEWFEPLGVASLIMEAIFIGFFIFIRRCKS